MQPSNEELYFAAVKEIEEGAPDKARDIVVKLEEREPESERTAILKAVMLESEGRLGEAVDFLQGFVGSHLESAHAQANLARLQYKMGDSQRALMSLRLALSVEPNQERALHLFAGLVEDQWSFDSCYEQLMALALQARAWLPALVAGELAARYGSAEQVSQALKNVAQKGVLGGDPALAKFLGLFAELSVSDQVAVWPEVRPYLPESVQVELDQSLLRDVPRSPAPSKEVWSFGVLSGGVLGELLVGDLPATCAVSSVRLLHSAQWIPDDFAGRYSRGLALQLCEALLLEHGIKAECSLACLPDQGLIDESGVCTVADLLNRHQRSGLGHLVSLYLSPSKEDGFVLDAEIYDIDGRYLSRFAVRSDSPEGCLPALAARLAQALPRPHQASEIGDWDLRLSADHVLAREVIAAFLLCERGVIALRALENAPLCLDLLADVATESQSLADLACLGGALRAAASLGVPSAQERFAVFLSTARSVPGLAEMFLGRS